MKPLEDQLHIFYKKVSANGNTEKRDIDGLSPAASPELASQLLMEQKQKLLYYLIAAVKVKMILKKEELWFST